MPQVGQVAQFGRNLAGQVVAVQVQELQVGQVAQFGRNLAGEVVGTKIQMPQVGQVAQLGRNLAGQVVAVQVQELQVGQVAQLGRNLARQVVAGQGQASNSTAFVRFDSMPSVQRCVGKPVVAIAPVLTLCRVKQDLEDIAIRQGRAVDSRARMRWNRTQPSLKGGILRGAHGRALVRKGLQRQSGYSQR